MNVKPTLNHQPLSDFICNLKPKLRMKPTKPKKIKKTKAKSHLAAIKNITGKNRLSKTEALEIEDFSLTPDELEAPKKALRILENEEKAREEVDLFPDKYSKEEKGRIVHKRLFDQGVLDADFGATYFGCFKSKDAFAYFKLYGSNNVCAIPGMDYRDFADEIFKEDFAFLDGHVFWK